MKTILSIDGGGIRGIIPALVLARLENDLGRPTAELFDLITGTSTGGILALGLVKDGGNRVPQFKAKDLAKIYERDGRKIFDRSFWKGVTSVGGLLDECYSDTGLEEVLMETLGDDPLGAAVTNVMVTTYDIQNRAPLFLKSWKDEHRAVQMWRAGRATAAAPTYFEPAMVPVGSASRALVDGGVFINSPAVSAYAEAKRLFGPDEDICLLSLGTGELVRPIAYKEAKDWGKAGWLLPLLSCVFDGVADAAHYQMRMLLGDQYVRMQISLDAASDDMDDASRGNINNLKNEAQRLLRVHRTELEQLRHCLKHKPKENQV